MRYNFKGNLGDQLMNGLYSNDLVCRRAYIWMTKQSMVLLKTVYL